MSVVEIEVNGAAVRVPEGITVAVALLNLGETRLRDSVRGAPRGPLCGMGTCQECRVTIDGVPHRRACLEVVRPGMRVVTGG
jgi:sarcosine oxidase subunit alpha